MIESAETSGFRKKVAQMIRKSMVKREPEVLESGLLLAATIIDVQNMDFLSYEHGQMAEKSLVELVSRIKQDDSISCMDDSEFEAVDSDEELAVARRHYSGDIVDAFCPENLNDSPRSSPER